MRVGRTRPSGLGVPFSKNRTTVLTPAPWKTPAGQSRTVCRLHGLFDLVEVEIEPDSWRRFSGPGGSPAFVKRDLYAATGRDEYEDCWFIEIDRGTESPQAVGRKCRAYDLYWRSGLEQADRGTYPLVLWVVPNQKRAQTINSVIARARNLNRDLFRCTTCEQFVGTLAGGAACSSTGSTRSLHLVLTLAQTRWPTHRQPSRASACIAGRSPSAPLPVAGIGRVSDAKAP